MSFNNFLHYYCKISIIWVAALAFFNDFHHLYQKTHRRQQSIAKQTSQILKQLIRSLLFERKTCLHREVHRSTLQSTDDKTVTRPKFTVITQLPRSTDFLSLNFCLFPKVKESKRDVYRSTFSSRFRNWSCCVRLDPNTESFFMKTSNNRW